MKSDQKLRCAECGHIQRFHKEGTCKAAGCKGCRGFSPDLGSSFLDKKNRVKGYRYLTPLDVAEDLSRGDGDLTPVLHADIIWNPGIYYRAYQDMGGFLPLRQWVMLCQRDRRS